MGRLTEVNIIKEAAKGMILNNDSIELIENFCKLGMTNAANMATVLIEYDKLSILKYLIENKIVEIHRHSINIWLLQAAAHNSINVAKYILENYPKANVLFFDGMTMKHAINSGNPELITLFTDRLPEGVYKNKNINLTISRK